MMTTFHPSTIETLRVPVSERTTWIFVVVTFDDGIVGLGEATRYGLEEAVLAVLAEARALITAGGSMGAVIAALRAGRPGEARLTAICGLEMAFNDALAQRAGVPLAVALGGRAEVPVPVYANINRGLNDRSPQGFARHAAEVLASGSYTMLKIAPFDDLHWSRTSATAPQLLEAGIDRILAVADAAPVGTRLLVDCHARLSPVMARRVLQATAEKGLLWLEDPLQDNAFDADTARALRHFANDRGVRLAGGEKLVSLAGARDLIAEGRHDVLLPDLCWAGTRTSLAILELALDSGIEGSLHNPAGPILDLASLHVAAASPDLLVLERQVGESALYDHVQAGAVTVTNSAARVPDAPGIGPADLAPVRRVLAG